MFRSIIFLSFLIVTAAPGQSLKSQIDSIVFAFGGEFNGCVIIGSSPLNVQKFFYGYANPSTKNRSIEAIDAFDMASLTKPFTGLVLLKMIDEGKINADDPVGKFIPELKPSLKNVTIRQLANHTNGIHDFYSLTQRHDTLSLDGIMKILNNIDTTVFTPGTRWGYSNSGYVLLGLVAERVMKKHLQVLVKNEILDPLKMMDAAFAPAHENVLPGFSTDLNPVSYNNFFTGAMGLYASANDVSSFYISVLSDTNTWKKYFRMAKIYSDPSNEEKWDYGFGWYFTKDRFGPFRAHSGRNPGAYNYMRWYDETDMFICILSNKNDEFIKPLREEICKVVMEKIGR